MRVLRVFFIGAILFGVPVMSEAQVSKSQGKSLSIIQLMKASDFKRCGLHRLSTEELKNLDAWLLSFTQRVASAVVKTPSVVESYIEGDFEGWDGDTIFILDNGQIWQQVSYAYTYHYAFRPKVIIFKSGIRYKMKVEGVSDTIDVKRLR